MGHVLTVEVPEEVYEPLRRLAEASGRRPEQLAADWLSGQAAALGLAPASGTTDDAWRELLSFAGGASLGRPTGADNAGIDADLARDGGRAG